MIFKSPFSRHHLLYIKKLAVVCCVLLHLSFISAENIPRCLWRPHSLLNKNSVTRMEREICKLAWSLIVSKPARMWADIDGRWVPHTILCPLPVSSSLLLQPLSFWVRTLVSRERHLLLHSDPPQDTTIFVALSISSC